LGKVRGVTSHVIRIERRYVYEDVDRHGNVRIYFWRGKGHRKVRILEKPGTEAFDSRYHELVHQSAAGAFKPPPRDVASPGTLRWLCTEYLASAHFRRLDKATQTARRRVVEAIFKEPVHPGAKELFADFPIDRVTTKSLRVLRDRKADTPGAASHRVKTLRVVFKWAVEEELITTNPASDLARLPIVGGGYHSWTVEEVAQFETRHPLGTKARLALALLMWTGVRRSDVVQLGRQHARAGWLKFVQTKNSRRKPVTIEVPVLPELQRVLDASPCGDLTYLVTQYGRPFTVWGFGNWFRDRCREAGVPGSAHGLRKAGAATAAENGATSQQLMAIFGWLSLDEAERYTRAAARRRMAGDAMGLLVRKDDR
jgi:integrase